MDRTTSSIQGVSSILLCRTGGVCPRTEECRCDRGNNISPLPGSSLHSSEEEFGEKTGHSGPVDPEQINTLSVIQNDHHQGHKAGPTSRCLYNIYKLKRCILAHPGHALLSEVPGVQVEVEEVD